MWRVAGYRAGGWWRDWMEEVSQWRVWKVRGGEAWSLSAPRSLRPSWFWWRGGEGMVRNRSGCWSRPSRLTTRMRRPGRTCWLSAEPASKRARKRVRRSVGGWKGGGDEGINYKQLILKKVLFFPLERLVFHYVINKCLWRLLLIWLTWRRHSSGKTKVMLAFVCYIYIAQTDDGKGAIPLL